MTKEERKEYNKKYKQEHKEYFKTYRKKYYQEHKDKCRKWQRKYRRNKKKAEENKIKTYTINCEGRIFLPTKYKNKFNGLMDIVFLKSGIFIYPHSDLNNNKDNIVNKMCIKGRISLGIKNFNKYYKYIPGKVRIEEYKKGLLLIPVKEDVEE